MSPFLRLLGFFAGVVLLLNVLRAIPGIGWMFHGFFSFWIAAILLSALLNRLSTAGLARRRMQSRVRELGNVESPHNQGKLGSLILTEGRASRAVGHLRRAVEGEPESLEWRYRLGLALLRTGQASAAEPLFAGVVGEDEEYAYGEVQLRLAEARLALGAPERALAALDVFDRNHGPRPESAYWRGLALRRDGRRGEAAQAFREVGRLAADSARFQRGENRRWVARAALARIF